MFRKNTPINSQRKAEVLASLKRDRDEKEKTYREQALKMFPHVCQRCGREFSGKRLRELTVHHKDGNHMNNPPDGSNWALLCLYCHDDAHGAYEHGALGAGGTMGAASDPPLGYQAFGDLRNMLPPESEGKPDKD